MSSSKNFTIKKIAQLTGHAAGVYAFAQGNSAHTVFTGSGDNFVAEWNLEKLYPEKFSVNVGQTIYSLCHIPHRNILMIGQGNGDIRVVDLKKKEEIKHFVHHKAGVFALAYADKRNMFVSAAADGVFSVWDAETFEVIRTIPICKKKLRAIDFNHDQTLMAVACGDGKVRVFDTEMFNELHTLEGHFEGSVYSVKFHPNLPLLLSGGKDAHLRFWKTDEEFKAVRAIPAHNFAIYSIVFSPDGQICATGSRDKTIKIWDADNFDTPLRIDKIQHQGHINSVNALYWNENPNRLISTGDDRTVMIWEVE